MSSDAPLKRQPLPVDSESSDDKEADAKINDDSNVVSDVVEEVLLEEDKPISNKRGANLKKARAARANKAKQRDIRLDSIGDDMVALFHEITTIRELMMTSQSEQAMLMAEAAAQKKSVATTHEVEERVTSSSASSLDRQRQNAGFSRAASVGKRGRDSSPQGEPLRKRNRFPDRQYPDVIDPRYRSNDLSSFTTTERVFF